MNTRLLVKLGKISDTRLDEQSAQTLQAGQVQVRVERFALTANNITYATFGDAMRYWQFFPTGQPEWGLVPVWGFGKVTASRHLSLPVGERLYGYWPMASEAVLQADRVSERGFVDAAPHRAALPLVYNQYLRCVADPFYTAATENQQALLRPLFITSWLIDDFMADNGFFGARTALLSSASSKTAYGTAFMLAQRAGMEVIGLTSAGNRAFCESLGCYHRVVSYEELDQLDAAQACVYIDFAGNAGLRQAVHSRFVALAYSCSVGGTHVEQLGGGKGLPGPRPTLFFAPDQVKKRTAEWGSDELGRRMLQAWQAFLVKVMDARAPWITVQEHFGPASAQAAYAQVLRGGDPRVGQIIGLAPL